MITIGITGGIGSGKTTATKFLQTNFLLPVIDADQISRQITKETHVIEAIKEKFGAVCIDQDQTLNRRVLADIVFHDNRKKTQLNELIHPLVLDEFMRQKQEHLNKQTPILLYDCPLLFEEHLESTVDMTLLIYSSLDNRMERIQKRDYISVEHIQKRIAAQMPLEDKITLADAVIYNDGTQVELEKAVDFYYSDVLRHVK